MLIFAGRNLPDEGEPLNFSTRGGSRYVNLACEEQEAQEALGATRISPRSAGSGDLQW